MNLPESDVIAISVGIGGGLVLMVLCGAWVFFCCAMYKDRSAHKKIRERWRAAAERTRAMTRGLSRRMRRVSVFGRCTLCYLSVIYQYVRIYHVYHVYLVHHVHRVYLIWQIYHVYMFLTHPSVVYMYISCLLMYLLCISCLPIYLLFMNICVVYSKVFQDRDIVTELMAGLVYS